MTYDVSPSTNRQIAFCIVAVPRYDFCDWGGTSRAISATGSTISDLRRLLRQIRCSNTRYSGSRPRRSHEMWLTDDEPRRMAEISLRFLSH